MTATVALRPAATADAAFVDDLVRQDAAALLAGLPADARAGLVETQVRGRRSGYARDWPDAVDHVIEADGSPVGRLLAAPVRKGVHVVDVRVREDRRGEGIGGAALEQVIGEAAGAGLAVWVRVDPANPAARLYRRLGFVEVPETGDAVDVLMCVRPS